MRVSRAIRLMAQRAGVDISRFPGGDPAWRRVRMLAHHKITMVIDVGANAGQYGAELRRFGFTGRIVSFEPIDAVFSRLQQRAATDPLWQALPYALGDSSGEVFINVAANAAESSSILPMLATHRAAAPYAQYVSTETVQQRRLDELWSTLAAQNESVMLKLDVQGYERHVIEGATETIRHCQGLQLEVSFVPLYEGGMVFDQALSLAGSLGYTLWSLDPGFFDPVSGRMLQADATFYRPV